MRKEEYIGTLEIRGHKVDVGMDDYGQQYFFEYIEDGELQEVGVGTYESEVVEFICHYFDKKGFYISLYGIDEWKEHIEHTKEVYKNRREKGLDEETCAHYEDMIYHMENDDYELYDFKLLYKNLGLSR